MVNVATVAPTSRIGTGVMWSTALHERQTRAGGRLQVPHCSHRVPIRPYFQSTPRNDGGAKGGTGSGRRGGSRSSMPRHDRKVAYESVSSAAAIWVATLGRARRAANASVVRKTTTVAP